MAALGVEGAVGVASVLPVPYPAHHARYNPGKVPLGPRKKPLATGTRDV